MLLKTERRRPDLIHENELRQSGCSCVAGLDEAGRGAWAGPIIAAAVVLPIEQNDLHHVLESIRDSKLMTPLQRMKGAERIRDIATSIGVGKVPAQQIDRVGVVEATRMAMSMAIDCLEVSPLHLLIDYVPLPEVEIDQTVITKGDLHVLSIAAASVIAKVTRDNIMVEFDSQHPGYGFGQHKGYGTKKHRRAIDDHGPISIHRYSFRPVAARSFRSSSP